VAFAAVPAGVPEDFNVLLITIDTIRADRMSAYGYPRKTTPNLDALAAAGTLFEHGWAHAPSTRYSIPAILTGRLPLDVHYDTSIQGWPGLAAGATTIAEALAPLGFTARGAITNYWYFDQSRRMDQGTTEYDNENARLHSGVPGAGPEQTRAARRASRPTRRSRSSSATPASAGCSGSTTTIRTTPTSRTPRCRRSAKAAARSTTASSRSLISTSAAARRAARPGPVRAHRGRRDRRPRRGLRRARRGAARLSPVRGADQGAADRAGARGPAAPRGDPRRHADLLPTLVNLAAARPPPRCRAARWSTRSPARTAIASCSSSCRTRATTSCAPARASAARDLQREPDTSWEVYRVDRDPAEVRDLAADPDECEDTRRAVERWFDAEQVPPGAAEALLRRARRSRARSTPSSAARCACSPSTRRPR